MLHPERANELQFNCSTYAININEQLTEDAFTANVQSDLKDPCIYINRYRSKIKTEQPDIKGVYRGIRRKLQQHNYILFKKADDLL